MPQLGTVIASVLAQATLHRDATTHAPAQAPTPSDTSPVALVAKATPPTLVSTCARCKEKGLYSRHLTSDCRRFPPAEPAPPVPLRTPPAAPGAFFSQANSVQAMQQALAAAEARVSVPEASDAALAAFAAYAAAFADHSGPPLL
jgi:hypothetical protein